jgi:hypothetical protein
VARSLGERDLDGDEVRPAAACSKSRRMSFFFAPTVLLSKRLISMIV